MTDDEHTCGRNFVTVRRLAGVELLSELGRESADRKIAERLAGAGELRFIAGVYQIPEPPRRSWFKMRAIRRALQ